MSRRRRTKQDETEGIGCAVLVLIVGVIYLFVTYPWLWYVLYAILTLLILGLVIKAVKAMTNALERRRAETERKIQVEEAQRQQRVRAKMIAWREKKRLEEQRAKLLRALALIVEVKPARDEECRRREEARRQAVEEEKKRQEEIRKEKLAAWERMQQEIKRDRENKAEGKKRHAEEQQAWEEEKRRKRFKELVEGNKFMNRVDQMSGIEFEQFMANFFLARGYSEVKMTPRSGDHGVDLLLTAEDRRIAVQLKRQVNPVGNSAVQAVFSGMAYYSSDEAWVVATSSFTKNAREAAHRIGVRLYGRSDLYQWLREPHDE